MYQANHQQQMQQYQGYGSAQGRMAEPSSGVSRKDLLYLEDALSWEMTAAKKAFCFAQECQDQQIRSECERMGQMHHSHYQMLLRHLQTPAASGQTTHTTQPYGSGQSQGQPFYGQGGLQ